MEKEFVPYEQALALKELEFNEPCLLHIQYSSGTDVFTGRKFKNTIWLGNGYDAEISDKKIKFKFPKHSEQSYGTLGIATFSQAFRWFREKRGLYGYPFSQSSQTNIWFKYFIQQEWKDQITSDSFNTHEEAELECLKKLIEIVKDDK